MLSKDFSARKTIKHLSKSDMFRSIIVLPHVRFQNQERKEKVVLIIRRHPVMLFFKLFLNLVYFILGFVLIFWAASGFGAMIGEVPHRIIFILTILNIAFFVTSLFYSFVTWYFNLVMATTERIVDIDFLSVLEVKWSEARLSKIEDVSVSSPGFLAALFNMGNLEIQTAGTRGEFEIRYIPKPLRVQDVIMDLVTAVRQPTSVSTKPKGKTK